MRTDEGGLESRDQKLNPNDSAAGAERLIQRLATTDTRLSCSPLKSQSSNLKPSVEVLLVVLGVQKPEVYESFTGIPKKSGATHELSVKGFNNPQKNLPKSPQGFCLNIPGCLCSDII